MSALSRQTTSDQVADEIRRQIWCGELRAGDRLTQEDLAAARNVSRIPVREALIVLAGEGAIHMAPHRGAFVEALSEASVADHYDLFGHVDGFALRRAIERSSSEDRGALAAEMLGVAEVADPVVMQRHVISARRQFHELGGSRRFGAVARGMVGLVPGNFFVEVPGSVEVAQRRLPEVGRAVAAGKAEAAVEAYEAMLQEHSELVRTALRARGVLQ